jgi:glycosyltransferase involved in cell wall biosynthesis
VKILIFAPNAGVSLSSGGGAMIALQMAEILGGDLGQEVWVAGYHSFPIEVLEKVHNVDLRSAHVQVTSAGSARLFRAAKSVPIKLSPYNLLLSRAFGAWVRSTIASVNPEVVWFHDDIPKAALPALQGRPTYLYVHFPLAARTVRRTPDLANNRGGMERLNDSFMVALRDRIVTTPQKAGVTQVWVNSSVTQGAVQQLWGIPGRVVYPYIRQPSPPVDLRTKLPTLAAVGTFTRAKGFHVLIDGFARAGLAGWTLVLAGHSRESGYLHSLERRAGRLGVGQTVSFRPDLSPERLEKLLEETSVICNGSSFEPLGLSLLEGMSRGAVPVTRRSASSGGWTDVCRRGEVGFGFESTAELSEVFRRLSRMDRAAPAQRAIARSREFSRTAFRSTLQETIA